MASLYKQDGRYYAQFFSQHRTPQRKRVPLKTDRKDKARRRLAALEERYRNGEFDPWTDDPWNPKGEEPEPPPPPINLGEAVEAYLASCAHLRPITQQTYRDVLRPFSRHVGEGVRVAMGSVPPTSSAGSTPRAPEP